jgi:hypothetical protein
MASTTRKSARTGNTTARKESRRNTGRHSVTSEHNPAPKGGPKPRLTAEIDGKSRLVHAYRRLPHMVMKNDKEVEVPVEVVCCGERIHFKSNDAGHIVAEVRTPEAYDRLTKEIPEAYIPYAGGENIPERKSADDQDRNAQVVTGKFVLVAGNESMVLDTLNDKQVREFAAENGLEEEQLPDVLTGDTLKQAVYNLLTGN